MTPWLVKLLAAFVQSHGVGPVWTSAGRLSAVSGPALKGRLSIIRFRSLRAELNRRFLEDLQIIVPETFDDGNQFSITIANDPTMWRVDAVQK